MPKRQLRKTNRTVLIVVEGHTEDAFINHVKTLFYQRGMQLSVSIKNAGGYGPRGIIDKLKSVAKTADFDCRYAVFDADVPLTEGEERWLQRENIHTIISQPAIEATLIKIIGRTPPNTTATCKQMLQELAEGDQTEGRYYERHFGKDLLSREMVNNPILAAIISAVSTENI